jgi:hypothetical protein
MKKKCVLGVFNSEESMVNSLRLVLCLTMIAAVSGCGKKAAATTSAPAPSTASESVASAPAIQTPAQPVVAQSPQSSAPVASAVQPNGQVDLAELNRTLIRWIVRNRRAPGNFQEFASSAGITVPPPPPGKKYIIAPNMHIQLVNQ